MKKGNAAMVSLALLMGLLLLATTVSAKNNVHVNSIDINSEPPEGRVVYADMKMVKSSDASAPAPGPGPAPAPVTSSSDGGGEN
jgi:hypothetical protein